ncbi:MAG: UMP kinase [Caldisphaera sp.]|jgi:uridylate kinase|uniref:UMP kinase n=1 Tax=Caldisphaera sp. TaxID=2060322 RepID=UPI003D145287
MEKIVMKISGSLLFPPDQKYYIKLKDTIENVLNKGYKLGVVVGGGPLARYYINTLRELKVSEAILDILGIESARLNALSLSAMLYPYSIPKVPKDLTETLEIFNNNLIPVLGGLQPGHSTNAVSMILAEAIGSKNVINMLNGINGIYTKNPKDPESKKLDKISYEGMEELIKRMDQVAGGYELLDHVALEIAKRSKIRVIFIDGKNPETLLKVLDGEKIGTELVPE